MVWRNNQPGSHIPSKSKRIVRLRQGNACICLDASVCTGEIDEYDHVVNIKALKIERSHANDPALLQGVCIPCHKKKTQAEAQAARFNRAHRKPQEHPAMADAQPGVPPASPAAPINTPDFPQKENA
jgi:5-methylcytosine-specific restriction endonuclease McrA